jgi:hypothetical protein
MRIRMRIEGRDGDEKKKKKARSLLKTRRVRAAKDGAGADEKGVEGAKMNWMLVLKPESQSKRVYYQRPQQGGSNAGIPPSKALHGRVARIFIHTSTPHIHIKHSHKQNKMYIMV